MDFISSIVVIGPSLYMCLYIDIYMYLYPFASVKDRTSSNVWESMGLQATSAKDVRKCDSDAVGDAENSRLHSQTDIVYIYTYTHTCT